MNKIADMVEQVEKLNDNTPDGYIINADTILVDLIEKCDYEFSGFAQDIFNIWSISNDKKSVEQMFYEFTGVEFEDYLEMCLEQISR